jgi:hypothetical protein
MTDCGVSADPLMLERRLSRPPLRKFSEMFDHVGFPDRDLTKAKPRPE